MKTIFDRHVQQMTTTERGEIWSRVANASRAAERAHALRTWGLAGAFATAALVAVVAFGVGRRDALAPRGDATPPAPRLAENVRREAPVTTGPKGGAVTAPVPAGAAAMKRAPGVAAHASARATAESIGAAFPATPALALRPVEPSPAGGATPVPAGLLRAPAPGTGAIAGRVVDERHRPVGYANVLIPGQKLGAMTDAEGFYRIDHVSAAKVAPRAHVIGYAPVTADSVEVRADQVAVVDLRMGAPLTVRTVEEIEVGARRTIDTKSSTTKQSISSERLREIPVDNLSQAVGNKAGVVVQGGELHFRGGRGGEVKYLYDGKPARPPVVPTTGGTKLPNDEAFDSMFFRTYGVNPFVATDEDALSTFAVDVDNGSYTLVRRYLELGELPPADAVRVEECVNFFTQGYPRPANDDFGITVDGAPAPFGPGCQLLRVGLHGRDVAGSEHRPAQLTFVIDVSGSMAREDRLGLVKQALRLLVAELHADDQVGIVVFGTSARVLLEPEALGGESAVPRDMRFRWDERIDWRGPASQAGREHVLEAIERLQPEGSTNTEEGLRLAYEMARRAYRPNAVNRILLCSDGVANVGHTGPESILASVRRPSDRGIHLSTIGFGMGNYNDALMEQLADQGDGAHYYVDDLREAKRVLVENLTGTLQAIARDAKVQVEFDSTRVLRWRLLGFENRDVADRDFRNDKVDAGEIGSGHEVTALYEVKLVPNAPPGPLGTVRLRWARPESEGAGAPYVREIARVFTAADLAARFESAPARFRLDAAVAEYAEILRGSYWAREERMEDVLPIARLAAHELHDAAAAEFVTLVERATGLRARAKATGAPGR